MRRIYYLFLMLCILLLSSCNNVTEKKPVKGAYSFLTKQGISQKEIKAIVLQDQKGNFYLIENQNEYSSVVEGFIERENSNCRDIKTELKKWGENFGREPFEPFKYSEELLSGDIIAEHQDRIITIGFTYCKNSISNLGEFIKGSISVERLDSLVRKDSNYSTLLNDPSNIFRHKPMATGDKVSLSYYRKVK